MYVCPALNVKYSVFSVSQSSCLCLILRFMIVFASCDPGDIISLIEAVTIFLVYSPNAFSLVSALLLSGFGIA